MGSESKRKPFYAHLYFQVLLAILIGILLGHFFPGLATKMKPLGDGFIKLIKMMIAPIIFTTVVVGIAKVSDMKEVGRVGLKALIYFELVSTLALAIGLVVVNLIKPGVGINADVRTLDANAVASYATSAKSFSTVDFFLRMIPDTVVGAFAGGEILKYWSSQFCLVSACRALVRGASSLSRLSINYLTRSSM
jgi:aerobic C4-dicarboxylate transport protein